MEIQKVRAGLPQAWPNQISSNFRFKKSSIFQEKRIKNGYPLRFILILKKCYHIKIKPQPPTSSPRKCRIIPSPKKLTFGNVFFGLKTLVYLSYILDERSISLVMSAKIPRDRAVSNSARIISAKIIYGAKYTFPRQDPLGGKFEKSKIFVGIFLLARFENRLGGLFS